MSNVKVIDYIFWINLSYCIDSYNSDSLNPGIIITTNHQQLLVVAIVSHRLEYRKSRMF